MSEVVEINIAGKSHRLEVEDSKRELYLLAERTVNTAIVKLERQSASGLSPKDAAGLVAFQLALSNILLRQQNELDGLEAEQLKALEAKVAEYMNDLKNEKR